jgi:hypothetical protein
MKKLIIFISLAFLTLVGYSQKADVTLDYTLDFDKTEFYYAGVSTDALGVSSDSTWTYTIKKKCQGQTKPVIGLKLNRVAVGGTVSVVYATKALATQTYSTITTVSWKKSSADTTIYFTPSSSTATNYIRISLTGSTSAIKGSVNYLELKIFED